MHQRLQKLIHRVPDAMARTRGMSGEILPMQFSGAMLATMYSTSRGSEEKG